MDLIQHLYPTERLISCDLFKLQIYSCHLRHGFPFVLSFAKKTRELQNEFSSNVIVPGLIKFVDSNTITDILHKDLLEYMIYICINEHEGQQHMQIPK
jgi:hypothetical protein